MPARPRNTKSGSTNNLGYKLPLNNNFALWNFKCEWGDGNETTVTGTGTQNITHQYEEEGIYTIRLEGQVQGIKNFSEESNKILSILQYGGAGFRHNLQTAFSGAINLDLSNSIDLPLIQNTRADGFPMIQTFRFCSNIERINLIEQWDLEFVSNMEFFLSGCPKYIGKCPIVPINAPHVVTYRNLFSGSTLFNDNCVDKLPIKTTVTDVREMFTGSAFSAENYSKFVIYWANMVHAQAGLPANLLFTNGSTIKYNSVNYGGTPYNNAPDAIAYLQSVGWTVTNGGLI